MKRLSILLVVLALPLTAIQGVAHEPQKGAQHKHETHDSTAAGTPEHVTGEVVDTGCYLSHEGRGAKHVSCATKCIMNGMPMGLLTSDGTLYLLTLNHDNPDPYNKLKEMAGKTVTVMGAVMRRGGMKGIDVTKFKPAAEPSTK